MRAPEHPMLSELDQLGIQSIVHSMLRTQKTKDIEVETTFEERSYVVSRLDDWSERQSVIQQAHNIAKIMMNTLHLNEQDCMADHMNLRVYYGSYCVEFVIYFQSQRGSTNAWYSCGYAKLSAFSSEAHFDGNLFLNGQGHPVYYLTVLGSSPTIVGRDVPVTQAICGDSRLGFGGDHVETSLRPRRYKECAIGEIIMPQINVHAMPSGMLRDRIMIRLAVRGHNQVVFQRGHGPSASIVTNLRV